MSGGEPVKTGWTGALDTAIIRYSMTDLENMLQPAIGYIESEMTGPGVLTGEIAFCDLFTCVAINRAAHHFTAKSQHGTPV